MTVPAKEGYTLLPLYSPSPTSSSSPPPYAHGIAQAEDIGLHRDTVASITGTSGVIDSRGEASGVAQGSTPSDDAAGTASSLAIEARLPHMTLSSTSRPAPAWLESVASWAGSVLLAIMRFAEWLDAMWQYKSVRAALIITAIYTFGRMLDGYT